jgi:hypothetical protein
MKNTQLSFVLMSLLFSLKAFAETQTFCLDTLGVTVRSSFESNVSEAEKRENSQIVNDALYAAHLHTKNNNLNHALVTFCEGDSFEEKFAFFKEGEGTNRIFKFYWESQNILLDFKSMTAVLEKGDADVAFVQSSRGKNHTIANVKVLRENPFQFQGQVLSIHPNGSNRIYFDVKVKKTYFITNPNTAFGFSPAAIYQGMYRYDNGVVRPTSILEPIDDYLGSNETQTNQLISESETHFIVRVFSPAYSDLKVNREVFVRGNTHAGGISLYQGGGWEFRNIHYIGHYDGSGIFGFMTDGVSVDQMKCGEANADYPTMFASDFVHLRMPIGNNVIKNLSSHCFHGDDYFNANTWKYRAKSFTNNSITIERSATTDRATPSFMDLYLAKAKGLDFLYANNGNLETFNLKNISNVTFNAQDKTTTITFTENLPSVFLENSENIFIIPHIETNLLLDNLNFKNAMVRSRGLLLNANGASANVSNVYIGHAGSHAIKASMTFESPIWDEGGLLKQGQFQNITITNGNSKSWNKEVISFETSLVNHLNLRYDQNLQFSNIEIRDSMGHAFSGTGANVIFENVRIKETSTDKAIAWDGEFPALEGVSFTKAGFQAPADKLISQFKNTVSFQSAALSGFMTSLGRAPIVSEYNIVLAALAAQGVSNPTSDQVQGVISNAARLPHIQEAIIQQLFLDVLRRLPTVDESKLLQKIIQTNYGPSRGLHYNELKSFIGY